MKKLIIALTMLLVVSVASAGVSAVTGACTDAGSAAAGISGVNLTQGSTESDTEIPVYSELQGVILDAPLTLDVGGSVSAGTPVTSNIVHFDPVGSPNPAASLAGSVTLDRPVLGLIYSSAALNASDRIVGNADVYESVTSRRIEGADVVDLTGNTVDLTLFAKGGIDEVRIIQLEPVMVSTELTSGPPNPVVNVEECWTIDVCVDSWDAVTGVVVQGGIGADLNITMVTVDGTEYFPPVRMTKKTTFDAGDVTLSKRGGKMGATIVTWDVGDMPASDGPICITLDVCTGTNASKKHPKQEYTSDGPHDLDGGFSAEYMLKGTELESPETEPLMVIAVIPAP